MPPPFLGHFLLTSAFKMAVLTFANVTVVNGRETEYGLEKSVWGRLVKVCVN
jgi:hypothetical protein